MFKMRFKTKFYIFLYSLIAVAAVVGVLAGMGVFDPPCTHPNSEIEIIVGKKPTCLNGGIGCGTRVSCSRTTNLVYCSGKAVIAVTGCDFRVRR